MVADLERPLFFQISASASVFDLNLSKVASILVALKNNNNSQGIWYFMISRQ